MKRKCKDMFAGEEKNAVPWMQEMLIEEKFEEFQRHVKLITSSQFLQRKTSTNHYKGMSAGFSSQLDRLEDYLKAIR